MNSLHGALQNQFPRDSREGNWTHKTKKGYGGLLAAGIECLIVKNCGKSCLIQCKGRGNESGTPPLFHGNVNDLEKL
jgi:hypothetical protein